MIWTDNDGVGTCPVCGADVAQEDVESFSVVHWVPDQGNTLVAMFCAEHQPHWPSR